MLVGYFEVMQGAKLAGFPASDRNLGVRDSLPGLESLFPRSALVVAGEQMTARAKQVVDGPVGGQEVLGLSGGFEAAHLPLILPGGLMGHFCGFIRPR